ncbi:hypothetical protein FrCorBMG51_00755 [Protofrankia coriariae]|uniref:Uncharacterized protein n=1 Tax=Protofrankia coriariae TaxID=1562887 RepID=A0ABR5F8W6_9ACTN|nr:hypothetical protein FrCorBMG51_00755 [Protofrankia coriariae]
MTAEIGPASGMRHGRRPDRCRRGLSGVLASIPDSAGCPRPPLFVCASRLFVVVCLLPSVLSRARYP